MTCDLEKKEFTRRQFLSVAGLTVAGLGFLPRWAAAAAAGLAGTRRKVLVVLFQRGAADGLNIVPPFLDAEYKKYRPSIRIDDPSKKEAGAIDLDGRFGLHPKLADLLPMWKAGRFAIIHAAGSPDGTRSHFDAQDYMESGTPGAKTTEDGWLNRALRARGEAEGAVNAVAIAPRLPLTLRGAYPALALQSADQLKQGADMADSFEALYDDAVDAMLTGAVRDLGEARKTLASLAKEERDAAQDLSYPKGRAGRDLHELARIIKADVGLKVGFAEMGGWDHHLNEGAAEGLLAQRLQELGGSIAAFYRELGDRAEDVLLLTMTEFGRTLEENGNRGTDHGHASVMLAFGGKVKGGRVHGAWPGLAREQLFEGRDLQVTTDYRRVVAEVLGRHFGLGDLSKVFPGADLPPVGLL